MEKIEFSPDYPRKEHKWLSSVSTHVHGAWYMPYGHDLED
jgi:hypothetical protein